MKPTKEDILTMLFKGYLIKKTGGHYYLINEEERSKNLDEVTAKIVAQLPLDIVDETSKTIFYCLDISSQSRPVSK